MKNIGFRFTKPEDCNGIINKYYRGDNIISLKEIIKLTKTSENQKYYIYKKGVSSFEASLLTIEEIKQKFNIKNTKVLSIEPRSTGFGRCLDIEIEWEDLYELQRIYGNV